MGALPDVTLGALLRRHRDRAGLTQEELAERAGVSARTISDVERGLREGVFRETATRIAEALALTGDERTRFESTARSRRSSPAPTMPVPLTRLIGREDEFAAIVARLREPRVRLLTLTGMGGIGKTRLAVEVANAMSPDFPDGVSFVALGQASDPALVVPLVASAVGVTPAREPVVDLIKAHLGTRRMLLVLDTFEHLLEAAPAVADLLANCPGLTVLATSRAPLRLRGEYEFAVPPLGLAADGPAAALFGERAQAVHGDLNVRGPAAPVVAEICRRLDGVPLAIELAAARVKHLPLSGLLDHLDSRLGLLTGGAQDLPHRQRTMRDTIAWSHDLLDMFSQALFRRLSVFAGWTLESAQTVCGPSDSVFDGLSALVDHSLVVLAESRYGMLDVVREYATELCEGAGETSEYADRHADHFLELAERAEPALRRAGQLTWHRTLDTELANVRQAFRWLVQRADAERALRLSGAMWMFWLWQGGFAEGRGWLIDAMKLSPEGSPAARAKALWGAGWLAYHQGDYRDTAAHAEALLDLAAHTGEPLDRRNGLTLQGMSHLADGDYAAATTAFDEALEICGRADAPWLLAASELNLGTALMHAGDLERAGALFAQSRDRYRELGDDAYSARAARHLATCQLLRGESPESREPLWDKGSGDWDLAESWEELAMISAVTGDARRAATLAAAAARVRDRTGTRPHPFDSALAEPFLQRARADAAEWDAGWQEGAEMPLDDVLP